MRCVTTIEAKWLVEFAPSLFNMADLEAPTASCFVENRRTKSGARSAKERYHVLIQNLSKDISKKSEKFGTVDNATKAPPVASDLQRTAYPSTSAKSQHPNLGATFQQANANPDRIPWAPSRVKSAEVPKQPNGGRPHQPTQWHQEWHQEWLHQRRTTAATSQRQQPPPKQEPRKLCIVS